jgi:hypothetical protein
LASLSIPFKEFINLKPNILSKLAVIGVTPYGVDPQTSVLRML